MPPTLAQQSIWDRWKKGVTSGWGSAPGTLWHDLTGGGVAPPTVKNKGLVPGSPAANAGGTLTSVEHFLGDLTKGSTWIRVGEVIVGASLLIAGIDHMFNTNMTGKLAKAAPYMMV